VLQVFGLGEHAPGVLKHSLPRRRQCEAVRAAANAQALSQRRLELGDRI